MINEIDNYFESTGGELNKAQITINTDNVIDQLDDVDEKGNDKKSTSKNSIKLKKYPSSDAFKKK